MKRKRVGHPAPSTVARPGYKLCIRFATLRDVSAATAADRFERRLEKDEAKESRRLDRKRRPFNLTEIDALGRLLWEEAVKKP